MSELSGVWQDRVHVMPMRVYYVDTDAGGVVYHANYLNFAERARTEMIRLLGVDQVALRDEQDLVFAVRGCEVEFLRPARLDDLLTVRSRLVHLGGASMHVAQSILRGEDELAKILIRLVCMTGKAKAARIPRTLQDLFHDRLSLETE